MCHLGGREEGREGGERGGRVFFVGMGALTNTQDCDCNGISPYSLPFQITEGYSGSDVKLVCKEAAMIPVRKVFDKLESKTSEGGELEGIVIEPIRTEDVKAAVTRTKPSAKLLVKRYVQWQSEYESI